MGISVCVCCVYVWLTGKLCKKPGALAIAEIVVVEVIAIGPV